MSYLTPDDWNDPSIKEDRFHVRRHPNDKYNGVYMKFKDTNAATSTPDRNDLVNGKHLFVKSD